MPASHESSFSGLGGNWQTYTPAWTSTGTAPALNNGTLTGKYMQAGDLVFVIMQLTMGTTTTFGTGNYLFTLPINAVAEAFLTGTVGARDDSGPAYHFGFSRQNGAAGFVIYAATTANTVWGATVPITFAQLDSITTHFFYEVTS